MYMRINLGGKFGTAILAQFLVELKIQARLAPIKDIHQRCLVEVLEAWRKHTKKRGAFGEKIWAREPPACLPADMEDAQQKTFLAEAAQRVAEKTMLMRQCVDRNDVQGAIDRAADMLKGNS
jgi:hypothetical protein